MRGPTILAGEEESKKYDFPDTFDRPPFTEMSKVYETNKQGKIVKSRHGRIQTKSEMPSG
jgi:hypothetical protein